MKWFRGRTAAKSAKAAPSAGKVESVVLYYGLTGDGFGTEAEREAVFALETRLDEVLQPEALGEVDGNEFGGGEASVYVYGPDCTRAWQAMEAEARRLPLRPAHVVLETTTGDRRRIDLAHAERGALMTRMGHDSMRAALIYQHKTQGADRKIADAMEAVIEAAIGKDASDAG